MLRSFAVFSIAVTLGAVFMWVVDALPPRIVRVVPEVASPGEVVRIVGRGFGGEPGKVWVGGRQLLQRNVRSWSGRTVEVELPKDVESGFVVVEARDGSRSNGVLFAVKEEIPVAYEEGASPVLSEVEPARVRIGQLVRLSGGGLSRLREGGRVFVTWAGRAAVQGEASRFLPVPIDQVISWTDEEVVFRMPEGAAGGEVFLARGDERSSGVFVEVDTAPGRREYGDAVTYALTFRTTVEGVRFQPTGVVVAWLPRVLGTHWQRNIRDVEETPPPFFQNDRRLAFRFSSGPGVLIAERAVVCDVYPMWIEDVDPRLSFSKAEASSYEAYTRPSGAIDAGDERLGGLFEELTGTAYERLWRLFTWVRDVVGYDPGGPGEPAQVLAAGRGSSLGKARLLAELGRMAGLPVRLVGGVLLEGRGDLGWYYWVEAALPGMGWVPVDPTAIQRVVRIPEGYRGQDEMFFLGGLSAQHLLLFREDTSTERLVPGGEAALSEEAPALWETSHEWRGVSFDRVSYSVEVVGVY
ncbi:transglutaminase domain-containing protein [Spirochaeta thermophila DSM 6578]|uniref:Transglutaminase domain-containing protein n=1 Tax=Winmispira thermophila (strain ATCC 700085 / DSM 6578 / Z-1203) TaxID=869211 RepID=G0GD46_WINT7|nr:transglutaminase domain-containing protein [Spirochaeta thermophila]AEJ62121.1 transglutaminase domain-containing protein [Spirochaeta thermophila DSM 6578]